MLYLISVAFHVTCINNLNVICSVSTTPVYTHTVFNRNGKSRGFQIWPVHSEGPSEQKSIKNFRVKWAWAYPGTPQLFRVPPIISTTTTFKFCKHICRLNRNKSLLKISGNIAVGVLRDSRQFSGHPYIYRAHRAVIFAIAQLSCIMIGLWQHFTRSWKPFLRYYNSQFCHYTSSQDLTLIHYNFCLVNISQTLILFVVVVEKLFLTWHNAFVLQMCWSPTHCSHLRQRQSPSTSQNKVNTDWLAYRSSAVDRHFGDSYIYVFCGISQTC